MLQQNPIRGFLVSVGLDPEIMVEFQYNPAQLIDKRGVNYAALNAPALVFPVRQYSHGNDRTITFTVRLDGVFQGPADDQIPLAKDENGSIWPELNKYRAFLYPKTERWQDRATLSSFAGLFDDNQEFASPPACLFGFGEDRVINCVVTDVNVTELMFNTQLLPLRADVQVTLVELAPYDFLGGVV
jgi:Contractile injection system tube protein